MLKHKQIQSGDIFQFYTVLTEAKSNTKHKRFLCKCVCGKEKNVLAFSLISGGAWNCGCKTKEVRSKIWEKKSDEFKSLWKEKCNNKKHGEHKTKEYRAWSDMKSRCVKESHKWFDSYGGRGIKVCEAWITSYENFLNDMGKAPSKNHQLDRKNNNGNYEPENCRWATPSQNQRNKSDSHFVETPDGIMNINDASDKYSLSIYCIKHRIKSGWDMLDVFLKRSQRIPNINIKSRKLFIELEYKDAPPTA